MSIAGLPIFIKNLETLMESKAFKQSSDIEQLILGRKLLRSKFGIGFYCKTQELKKKKEVNDGRKDCKR